MSDAFAPHESPFRLALNKQRCLFIRDDPIDAALSCLSDNVLFLAEADHRIGARSFDDLAHVALKALAKLVAKFGHADQIVVKSTRKLPIQEGHERAHERLASLVLHSDQRIGSKRIVCIGKVLVVLLLAL